MKVLSVMRAESVRALRTVGGDFGYPPTAVAALVEQYGFLSVPTHEELTATAVDPTKGITFRRGKLEVGSKLIAIDYMQVFAAGLSVATHSNTSESDLVLDHLMQWAQSQFKFKFEEIKPGIGHASQLEIRLEHSLPAWFPILSEIGSAITKGLDEFWGVKPSYELITINFWHDKTKYPQFAPPIFRLDRRESVSFEQEVYYSEAPMSTDNHITVLERLERICVEALKK
jgi:hypothetical protein